MNDHSNNKNLIKPLKPHYRLELITPDCFKYREHKQADGSTKIYKIPALKRFFAVRIRQKCVTFLKANNCKRIEDRYSTYYLPDLNIAKRFAEYLNDLKEILTSELVDQQLLAIKQGDKRTLSDLEKKLAYLQKHWNTNKPRFNVIQALPVNLGAE